MVRPRLVQEGKPILGAAAYNNADGSTTDSNMSLDDNHSYPLSSSSVSSASAVPLHHHHQQSSSTVQQAQDDGRIMMTTAATTSSLMRAANGKVAADRRTDRYYNKVVGNNGVLDYDMVQNYNNDDDRSSAMNIREKSRRQSRWHIVIGDSDNDTSNKEEIQAQQQHLPHFPGNDRDRLRLLDEQTHPLSNDASLGPRGIIRKTHFVIGQDEEEGPNDRTSTSRSSSSMDITMSDDMMSNGNNTTSGNHVHHHQRHVGVLAQQQQEHRQQQHQRTRIATHRVIGMPPQQRQQEQDHHARYLQQQHSPMLQELSEHQQQEQERQEVSIQPMILAQQPVDATGAAHKSKAEDPVVDPQRNNEQAGTERMEGVEDHGVKPPLVVLDGANVAYAYAQAMMMDDHHRDNRSNHTKPEPDARGIRVAVSYFRSADLRVLVVLPAPWFRTKPNPGDPSRTNAAMQTDRMDAIRDLRDEGLLVASPPKDDDDAYALLIAQRENNSRAANNGGTGGGGGLGYVLSNDMFRDAQSRDPTGRLKKWLTEGMRPDTGPGRISFAFCDTGRMDDRGDVELDIVPNPRHPLVVWIEQQREQQQQQNN